MPDGMPQGELAVGSKICLYHIRGESWTCGFTAQNEFKSIQSNKNLLQTTMGQVLVWTNMQVKHIPAVGTSKPKGRHIRHIHVLILVYLTDVITEVNFQSLDQQPFFHQFLIQRLNGPGDKADQLFRKQTHKTSISVNHHICRELSPDLFPSAFVSMQIS